MNDIIGHDIDGRPLRVGDEVVVVGDDQDVKSCEVGKFCEVSGPSHYPWVDPRKPEVGLSDGEDVRCSMIRKLHNDHRPATESFTEIISKFKGVGV